MSTVETLTNLKAINKALADSMEADDRVLVLGEDVADRRRAESVGRPGVSRLVLGSGGYAPLPSPSRRSSVQRSARRCWAFGPSRKSCS
jgi:hypothetical protein